MQAVIQKLVSKQSLSSAEAAAAMHEIVGGGATDAQIAAFLVALRMKGETPEEIAGFASALLEKAQRMHIEASLLLDTCGTGGDGAGTFNISTAVAFVVAGAGVPVVKHGNRAVSSSCGSADVLEALGVNLSAGAEVIRKCIQQIGIGFLFAPLFHPSMKRVASVRKDLGMRTVFNLLGPLVNPAGATHQLVGVYDSSLTETLAEALRRNGTSRALVVHGVGLDEITTCGETKITELSESGMNTFTLSPEEVGMARSKKEELKGGNAKENADILKKILGGEHGPKRDIVILNSAAALYLCGKANSIKNAVPLAEHSLDSGSALKKLNMLVAMTHRNPELPPAAFLSMIVAHTREVVEARKKTTPLETLKRIISSGVGQVRSFKAALRKSHLTLIAEIKRASPSAGNIQEDADPLEVARAYASAGADAISVLTEERFFKGSLETLRSLRKEVSLPLLRKEFILDEYQVYESRAAGADAILLIVTLLTSEKLSSFITLAGSLGMDCLVECHTEAELKQALAAGADIIGINNRDLATFRIDSTVFSRLRPLIPEGKFVVCESGISSREDALRARNEGADAILVGTALMKAPDIAKKARELRGE